MCSKTADLFGLKNKGFFMGRPPPPGFSTKGSRSEDVHMLCIRKHIFLCLLPDAPVLPSPCLSSPSLPPPPPDSLFFLLFYLRSQSEGLTISSSVSPLSCRAVYCLWFARAHPCGCSFQLPSVTWWIEGDPRRSSQPWATLILLTWDGAIHTRSLPDLSG